MKQLDSNLLRLTMEPTEVWKSMEMMSDLEEVNYSETRKKMIVSSVRVRTGHRGPELNSVEETERGCVSLDLYSGDPRFDYPLRHRLP